MHFYQEFLYWIHMIIRGIGQIEKKDLGRLLLRLFYDAMVTSLHVFYYLSDLFH